MLSGLYTAATAMEVAARRHELIAENLANTQMTGFRRRVLPQTTFEAMLARPLETGQDPRRHLLGTAAAGLHHDFTQGHLIQTGRKLDLAIEGDGFFGVQGPEGALYTRNGVFSADASGTLRTMDGLAVRGLAGPVILPQGASTETIQVMSDGRLLAGGAEFAQLELTRFNSPPNLVPAGSSLYMAPPDAGPTAANVTVHQGALESSNVSTVSEMAEMISNSRQYEAAQRALTTISEAIQKRIGLR